jgi:hypothetical protein
MRLAIAIQPTHARQPVGEMLGRMDALNVR